MSVSTATLIVAVVALLKSAACLVAVVTGAVFDDRSWLALFDATVYVAVMADAASDLVRTPADAYWLVVIAGVPYVAWRLIPDDDEPWTGDE